MALLLLFGLSALPGGAMLRGGRVMSRTGLTTMLTRARRMGKLR